MNNSVEMNSALMNDCKNELTCLWRSGCLLSVDTMKFPAVLSGGWSMVIDINASAIRNTTATK